MISAIMQHQEMFAHINNKDYNGTGIYDQLVIGRMEVNVAQEE